MKRLLILTAMTAFGITTAWAQAPNRQQAPNMPPLERMPPEKIEPDPDTTGSTGTLSDKLEQSDGVIRPPTSATPDMNVPAPEPNPGTTPVIPPPGSSGGNPRVDPK